MEFDGKLVFTQPHDGTGRLVFGDAGDEVVPDVTLSVDGDLPGLGTLTLRAGTRLGIDAELPGLDCSIGLEWDANVSRGMRAEVQTLWQEAQPLAAGVAVAWQRGKAMRTAVEVAWQEGMPVASGQEIGWQDGDRLRAGAVSHWQEGVRRRHALDTCWQESERVRAAALSVWQEGVLRRGAVLSAWQEQARMRNAVVSAWQDGIPLRHVVRSRWSDGVHMRRALRSHWQEGRRPPIGVSATPVDPPEPPCYDPATVGRLIFTEPFTGDGRLVFICQRVGPGPEPGDTIVVPVRRFYMTVNSVSLARADGTPLPASAFGMSLDADSWTWQWTASLHASALPLITPGSDGNPVQVVATINGIPYRLLAESYSRERQFGSTRVNVKGRGIAALLDAPYSPALNHGNALARTGQQLMGEVLTLNGVGIGWDVDWQLTDWLVPGGVWTHQGSYMSALLDIAGAVGGYIQPHDTAQTVRALRRYPDAPWRWSALTPDYELPSAVVSVEGIEWERRALYDRVFVSGVSVGITGNVRRAGTAGLLVAPGVTHPLITETEAARQRGIAELGSSGLGAQINLRLPVLSETGVIKPGSLVRYVDVGTTHLGFVRSTSVEWSMPTLRQVLSVETHPE